MDWLIVASLAAPFVVIGLLTWHPLPGIVSGFVATVFLLTAWSYRQEAPYREFVTKCHMAQNSVITDEFQAAYCVDMRTVKFERFTG